MKKKLVTITTLAITFIIVQTTKSISLNRTQMKQSYTQHKPNAQPEEADLAITLCEAIINHPYTDPDAQTSIAANIWHYNYTMTKLKSTNPSLYNNLIQKNYPNAITRQYIDDLYTYNFHKKIQLSPLTCYKLTLPK